MKTKKMTKASRDNLNTVLMLVILFALIEAASAAGLINSHLGGLLVKRQLPKDLLRSLTCVF